VRAGLVVGLGARFEGGFLGSRGDGDVVGLGVGGDVDASLADELEEGDEEPDDLGAPAAVEEGAEVEAFGLGEPVEDVGLVELDGGVVGLDRDVVVAQAVEVDAAEGGGVGGGEGAGGEVGEVEFGAVARGLEEGLAVGGGAGGGDASLPEGASGGEGVGGVAVLLVGEELSDELGAGVLGVGAGGVGVVVVALGAGGARAGEDAGLDLHQGGGHEEELAGVVDVDLGGAGEVRGVLVGDLGDGDVGDLDLGLSDEVEEEVEGPVEGVEMDAVLAHWTVFFGRFAGRALGRDVVYPLAMESPTVEQTASAAGGAGDAGDDLALAREVMRAEARAVVAAADGLDARFTRAVDLIEETARKGGSLVVSGMGKSGLIGAKISATIASVGAPSHVVHPAEAVHGDLGRITTKDCLLALSYSGTTAEVVALASIVRQDGIPIISVTRGRSEAALDRLATVALSVGAVEEACPLSLAPTSSTTATLAVGDALAMAVSRRLAFTADDFAKRHPGGWLGELLKPVTEALRFRVGENLSVAHEGQTVAAALEEAESAARRPGAMVVVDAEGKLTGLFTDSDLRRLVLRRADAMEASIESVMTRSPRTLGAGASVRDAMELVREVRADEIPVIDADGRPVGVLDVQDLLAMRVASR